MKPETMLLRGCFVAFASERRFAFQNLTALGLAITLFGVTLGISGCETGTEGSSGFIQEKGIHLGAPTATGNSSEIKLNSELGSFSRIEQTKYVSCEEELVEGAVGLQKLLKKDHASWSGRFYRSKNEQPIQSLIYLSYTPHLDSLVLDTWPNHFAQLKISYSLQFSEHMKQGSSFEMLAPEGEKFQFKAFYCPQKEVLVLRDPNGSEKNQREIIFQRKDK